MIRMNKKRGGAYLSFGPVLCFAKGFFFCLVGSSAITITKNGCQALKM